MAEKLDTALRRYRIEGTLTALSPLHIGSGMEKDVTMNREKVRVMEVITSVNGLPFIPATTLKGRLHQWANRILKDSPEYTSIVWELFGIGKEEAAEAGGLELAGASVESESASGRREAEISKASDRHRAGQLIFLDAHLEKEASKVPDLMKVRLKDPPDGESPFPLHWDESRFTYVMASTVLNRVTRTAEPNKLYHFEAVPPGAVFKVVICGEGLADDHLAFLLTALTEFSGARGMTLGGLSSHSFGSVAWKLKRKLGFRTTDQLANWLNNHHCGFDELPSIHPEDWRKLERKCQSVADELKNRDNGNELKVTLRIDFDGPFMINDPSSSRKKDHHKDGESGAGVDHVYLRDIKGKVVLSAKSLRGGLRAQAERIVRTVFQSPASSAGQEEPAGSDSQTKACHIDSRERACKPIHRIDQVESLCATCRLFGGNGWRSPLTFSDFTPVVTREQTRPPQEFVAIDRFSGGAAHKKKFNALYSLSPSLEGELRIDLNRIEDRHAGLLVLTLRDLVEGDVPLGFGRSKGFGACRAAITRITPPDTYPGWASNLMLQLKAVQDLYDTDSPLKPSQAECLEALVRSFLQHGR